MGSEKNSAKVWSFTESDIKRFVSNNYEPNPLDFDHFLPWLMCVQYEITNVTVKRKGPADFQPVEEKLSKISMNKFNKTRTPILRKYVSDESSKAPGSSKDHSSYKASVDDLVTILVYYDSNGKLTEIAFIDCLVPVRKEVFNAVKLCLPYHSELTRITWKGAHLTSAIILEMSRLLQGSDLTDVIIDGSYVPQGNFYVLLDQTTKLKYLSLSNCKINDTVCEMIAQRIQRNRPAAENLLVLNLSSNLITDVGAEALGHSLRTNRRLLYLNLCNNCITSVGAAHILLPLTKFPLNSCEKTEMCLIKWNSAKLKLGVSSKCLLDVTNVYAQRHNTQNKLSKPKKKAYTEKTASDSSDVYISTNKEERGGIWFSAGNFTLCGLNLAHNQLDVSTVTKIAEVVSYQFQEDKGFKTGLLRVVIEGNSLPSTCAKYDFIAKFIKLAIGKAISIPHKKEKK